MTVYTHRDALRCLCVQAIDSILIRANVEFGVLQSNGNCVNIGICRINTTHCTEMEATRPKQRRCPLAEALLSVNAQGRLRIFFPRAGMMPCTERAFFSRPIFPVPTPYFLPDSIQNNLPGLEQNIISEGLYPIRRTAEGYWVEF